MSKKGDTVSVVDGKRHVGKVVKVDKKEVTVDFPDGDDGVYGIEEVTVIASKGVDLAACELELRKYVKRDGGYRKDVTDAGKKRAKQVLKLLDRKTLVWDKVLVPFHSEQRMKV